MNRLVIALSAAAAIALTTASLSAAPPKVRAQIPHQAIGTKLRVPGRSSVSAALFVSVQPDSGTQTAGLYGCSASNCSALWTVPMSAYGVAVDGAGNAYVASDTYPQGIYVFPPAGNGPPPFPKLVLDDRGFDPFAIAVAPNGTVLVANEFMDSVGNQQVSGLVNDVQILAYKPGATKPYEKFAIPSGVGQPLSLALDAAGNVYASFYGSGLFKYTSPTAFTQLPLARGIEPWGLEVDASGNLALLDHGGTGFGSAADVYSLPGMQQLRSFTVSRDQGADVGFFTLDPANSYLFAQVYDGSCGGWAISNYDYHSGSYLGCFNLGGGNALPGGIAADPPSNPAVAARCAFARGLLSGCGGGARTALRAPAAFHVAPLERVARGLKPVSGSVLYVSDFWNSNVTEYAADGSQIAQVAYSNGVYGAQGLTTDAQGNVYVANTQAENVLVYSPGLANVIATLYPVSPGTTESSLPSDVAVDNATGVVAVTTFSADQSRLGPGSVMFFAKGATKPCAMVTSTGWQQMNFAAFDATGTLYIDGRALSGKTLIGRVRGECSAHTIANLSGANIAYPGGIQIVKGNLLIDDQGTNAGSVVYTYKLPKTAQLGAPLYTTKLGSTHSVAGIAADKTGTNLWLADTNPYGAPSQEMQNGAGSGTVYETAYPAGGAPVGFFSPGNAQNFIGIAISPNAQP